jgi:signal transduction histidine kinase
MLLLPTNIQRDVIQHYLDRSGNQNWLIRVASSFTIVALVFGLEGFRAALMAIVWWIGAGIIEHYNYKRLQRQTREVGTASEAQLDKIVAEFFFAISFVGAYYSLPAFALIFGDQNGKLLGLVIAATCLMNMGIQNVFHPRVAFFSLPVPTLAFIAVVMSLASDRSPSWLILIVGLVFVFQTTLLTLTVARTDRALLNARRIAQEETKARGEADSANEAKTNFLATMSHELRTPLNAVIGYGELLRENAEFEERTNDVDDIDKVLLSGRRLLQLVGDILDMSQLNAGGLSFERSPFDVTREVTSALDDVALLVQANQNVITSSLSPDLGVAISDAKRFRQCVQNLLSNAAKFTKGGAIHLDAIRHCDPRGDTIVVSITDNGIGIAPDQLSRLFQPFTQVDDSKTRAYEGAGLGLALTRALAMGMGGDVGVTSALGQGSRFTLTINANAVPPALAA